MSIVADRKTKPLGFKDYVILITNDNQMNLAWLIF